MRVAKLIAALLATAIMAGSVLAQGRTHAPHARTGKPAMSDAAFEELAGRAADLYDEAADLSHDEALSQAERQKRHHQIMQRVRELIARMHQGGRNFYTSKAYLARQAKMQARNRAQRLLRIRRQLDVKDDGEWQVLAARIDHVIRTRDQLTQAMDRTQLSSPAAQVQALRAEADKPGPDTKRIKALLANIRADREAARQDVARFRTALRAAQQDLISILTLKQEAVLLVSQVID